MATCLVCGSGAIASLLDLGPQSVSSHFIREPGAAVIRHPLGLSVCRRCGVVQLARPFPYQDLTPPYAWITYREPEAHLDKVVQKLMALPGIRDARTICGVSFKDLTTLERFGRLGFTEIRALDAARDLGTTNPNANIESVQGKLTPALARSLVEARGLCDVLVARHIAEHAEDPRGFMEALGLMLAPGGLLVIEVPDCRANLKRQDVTMIWEEHSLYLTPETLPQLLAPAGCALVDLAIHPFAFEDVIVMVGRKTVDGARMPEPGSEAVQANIALAQTFAAGFPDWTARYRQILTRLTQDGRRLAAYGAGHLTCAFLHFHGLSEFFAFVVDDTPQKQGLFLPQSGLPIVAKERLTAKDVAGCVFGLAPEIEDRVIGKLALYADAGGRFYSMFADSPRSLRTLAAS